MRKIPNVVISVRRDQIHVKPMALNLRLQEINENFWPTREMDESVFFFSLCPFFVCSAVFDLWFLFDFEGNGCI